MINPLYILYCTLCVQQRKVYVPCVYRVVEVKIIRDGDCYLFIEVTHITQTQYTHYSITRFYTYQWQFFAFGEQDSENDEILHRRKVFCIKWRRTLSSRVEENVSFGTFHILCIQSLMPVCVGSFLMCVPFISVIFMRSG